MFLKYHSVTSPFQKSATPRTDQWTDIIDLLKLDLTDAKHQKEGRALIGASIRKDINPKDQSNPAQGYWRQNELVESLTWIALDIEDADYGTDSQDDLEKIISGHLKDIFSTDTEFVLYSTWNHGVLMDAEGKEKWKPKHPRLRLIIPLSAPLSPLEWRIVRKMIADVIPGCDPSCKDLVRLQYTPRPRNPLSTLDPWLVHHNGDFLDPLKLTLWPSFLDSELTPFESQEDLERRCEEVLNQCSGSWDKDLVWEDAVLQAFITLEKLKKHKVVSKFKRLLKASKVCSVTDWQKAAKSYDPLSYAYAETYDFSQSVGGDLISKALEYIHLPEADPSSYDRWIKTGMALQHHVSKGQIDSEEAFEIFLQWSKKEPKFSSESEVRSKWETLSGYEVSLRYIFGRAQKAGWKAPAGSAFLTGNSEAGFYTGSQVELALWVRGELSHDPIKPKIEPLAPMIMLPDPPQEDLKQALAAHTLVYGRGDFYQYKDGYFQPTSPDAIKASLMPLDGSKVATSRSPLRLSNADCKGATELLKADLIKAHGDDFFGEELPYVAVPYQDRVLHLHPVGEKMGDFISDHHPMFRFTHKLPVSYDPKAECPTFLSFLDSCFAGCPDAQDRINALQEYIGATLLGVSHKLQKAVLLVGEGSNGKSTLVNLIESMFDPSSVCHIEPSKIVSKAFDWDRLLTSQLNTVADVSKTDLLDTSMLKAALGGDALSAPRKYKDPVTGKCTAGHLWGINELPAVADHTYGFWRKWLLIEFPHNFQKLGSADETLPEKLQEELSGVVNWAIEGGRRLIANNYKITTPQSHHDSINRWKNGTNNILAFAQDHQDPNLSTLNTSKELYASYKDYCKALGTHPKAYTKFAKGLASAADDLDIRVTTSGGTKRYAIRFSAEKPVTLRVGRYDRALSVSLEDDLMTGID